MKKLNKLQVILFFMAFVVSANAQKSVLKIGNNPTAIGSSSVLEIESANKGLLLPRVATAGLITAPVDGMMVYDEFNKCVRGYEDGAWGNCYNGNAAVNVVIVGTLAFATHNLGADTSLDPHVPVQGIHGNYYQWGRPIPVADASTPAAAIVGWNTSAVASDAWVDGIKTANDPCPTGFRVPTKANWDTLVANNVRSSTGSWVNDATNFGSAAHWGPDVSTKWLTLPAAGQRINTSSGALVNRGSRGYYWTSSGSGSDADYLNITNITAATGILPQLNGFSVRCILE